MYSVHISFNNYQVWISGVSDLGKQLVSTVGLYNNNCRKIRGVIFEGHKWDLSDQNKQTELLLRVPLLVSGLS